MTIVYAESSAVLRWLLGEPNQDAVIEVLADAEAVTASSLTVLECARALLRARMMQRISAAEERAGLGLLDDAVQAWHLLDVSEDVVTSARRRFPHEPVRSVDALHLASALTLQNALGRVHVLSLDDRVRRNAAALGMPVAPPHG
jgi:predicted nucleic acid-binding protein